MDTQPPESGDIKSFCARIVIAFKSPFISSFPDMSKSYSKDGKWGIRRDAIKILKMVFSCNNRPSQSLALSGILGSGSLDMFLPDTEKTRFLFSVL